MRVDVRETGTWLDESLHMIAGYLRQRVAAVSDEEVSRAFEAELFDLAAAGMGAREGEQLPTRWRGRRVFPLRLVQSKVVVGPSCDLAVAGGPCPACLDTRWAVNRREDTQRMLEEARPVTIAGPCPSLTPFALEALWTLVEAILRGWASQDNGRTAAPFYVLNLVDLRVERHAMIADSRCPVCSTPAPDTAEAARITLTARPKRDPSDLRLMRVEDYDLAPEGLVNPVAGMLGTQIIPDYTGTITAPMNGFFWVKNPKFDSYHQMWWGGHAYSYGQSKRVGLLEGLERYSGQMPRAKAITVFDSYDNLSPDAFNPADYGLYRPEFYQRLPGYYQPFEPDVEIYWTWGYSFKKRRPILVPEQMVYYLDYRPDFCNFVQECSNGCAIGSCLEEAILHGLLELVERDAFLITWNARLGLPRIDPWSCGAHDVLFMLDRLDRLNYDTYLFDMRFDLAPPAVLCAAVKRDDDLGKLVVAAGSSLEPMHAVRAAMVEVASYVPGFRTRVENRLEELQPMTSDFRRVRRLTHHGLLFGLPEMMPHAEFLFANQTTRTFEETYRAYDAGRQREDDLRADLTHCIDDLLKLGMDVVVVDQTPPELARLGLASANVIVPGLLPIDFGWERQRVAGSERLRTVPRTAGYYRDDFQYVFETSVPHPFP